MGARRPARRLLAALELWAVAPSPPWEAEPSLRCRRSCSPSVLLVIGGVSGGEVLASGKVTVGKRLVIPGPDRHLAVVAS